MSAKKSSIVRELAAAALVPAGVIGFIRVFDASSSVIPIVGASLLSTFVAAVLRRRNVPLPLAALVSALALAIVIVLRYAPDTSAFGIIPTPGSREPLELLARDGLQQFRDLRAPVPDLPAFIAFAMIGAWLMAFLTDWGAQRLGLAFEPVLPGGLLFVFSAVLGAGERRISATLVFAAAVLFWAVVQRTEHLAQGSAWLNSDQRRGPAIIARNAGVVAIAALLIGTVVGPRLPGADEEELFYWRSKTDPTRTVVSPFVEIGDRLVEQQDTNLFTVTSDRPAYWRVAGLDTYNEEQAAWSTRLTFEDADGSLPGERSSTDQSIVITQNFTIQNLSAIWLPAAFAPSRILESPEDVTWNTDTASLAIGRGDEEEDRNSDGLIYELESVLPIFDANALRSAGTNIPPEIAERYLEVPSTLTPRVINDARTITAGATTNYDRALALQDHFREYDYSLSLSPRAGDPIEQFLDERVGFCQQFSGTFALMARSLGIPTRVAVGFTWGDPIAGQENTYQVTGRHTHAWPEVWFEDFGWVAFEPTPGRGAPDATYTGVGEQQDSLVQQTLADPLPAEEPDPAIPVPDQDPDIGDIFEDPAAIDDAGASAAAEASGGLPGPRWMWITLLVIGLYAAIGPLLRRFRRQRRSAHASAPADRIAVLWADAADDIADFFDIARTPSETRSEFADRLQGDPRLPPGALRTLADATTIAHYGGNSDAAAAMVDQAEAATTAITEAVNLRTTAVQRWKQVSKPSSILRASRRDIAPARPTVSV